MPNTIGIRNLYRLAADQQVAASTVLVTAAGLSFAVQAGRIYHVDFSAIFTIGATGGFKFELNAPAAPTSYTGFLTVFDTVTPGYYPFELTAIGAAANALAVAGTHSVFGSFDVVPSVAGTIALQFACNSAANGITLKQGAALSVVTL